MEHESFIDKFRICEYMELLDEVICFWHGDYDFSEEYSLALKNAYSCTCHPPIDSVKSVLSPGECSWKTHECQIYALCVDINKWKNLNWDEISTVIKEPSMVDILITLLREQILVFYRSGLLESDNSFKEIILQYIVNFDELKFASTKEDFTYIYNNGFCQVANELYKNDFISAKNKFINFAKELEKKRNEIDNLPNSLVKSRIETIIQRKGGDKVATQEGVKNLKVFSKKINDAIDFLAVDKKLSPLMLISSWLDNGWNNYSGSWMDKGWNNYSGSWMDKGWNNYSGSWSDSGWNNYSGSWSDSGWTNSGGGGGCYITTATMENLGLGDDCDELNLLRMYRDKLAEDDPNFKKIVLEYYKTAPKIVKEISESDNKEEILNNIYNDMISPVIELLKAGKLEEAKAYYIEKYNDLKDRYVLGPQKLLNKKF